AHPESVSGQDGFTTVAAVSRALEGAGYEVRRLGVGTDPHTLVAGLRAERPDVVFNLFEGLATQGQTEATVAGLLEWLGVPFTGSSSTALSLAPDQFPTLHLLRGEGLPVAAVFLVERLPCP